MVTTCDIVNTIYTKTYEHRIGISIIIILCQFISDHQQSAIILQDVKNLSGVSSMKVISYIYKRRVLSEVEDIVNKLGNSKPSESNEIGTNLIQTLTKIVDCCVDDLNNETREAIRSNIESLCAKISLIKNSYDFRSKQVAGLILTGNNVVGSQRLRYRVKMTSQDQIVLVQEMNVVDEIPNYSNYTKDVVDLPIASIIANLSISEKHFLDRLIAIVYVDDKLFKSSSDVNIVSKVMYVHISGMPVHNLEEDIKLTFEHEQSTSSKRRLLCVYWNQDQDEYGSWDQRGCRVLEAGQDFVTCGCNHLSSFALMLSITNIEEHEKPQEVLSIVGCVISILSLSITLLTYWMFPFLRLDIPSKILICLCSSLLAANIAFVANVYIGHANAGQEATWLCKSVAMLLHYSMLSALVWMACDSCYLYLAMTKVFISNMERVMLVFQIIGWGFPLLAVLVTSIYKSLDNYNIDNSNFCWIKEPVAYYVFVVPAGLIMTVNLVIFGIVLHFLKRASNPQLSPERRKEITIQLKGALSLASLLGLTWLFGFLAIWLSPVAFSYLFVIFNSLQGFFIFVFYCFLKPDVSYFWTRCFREWLPSKEIIVEDTTKGPTETPLSATCSVVVEEGEQGIQNEEHVDTGSSCGPVSLPQVPVSFPQPNLDAGGYFETRPLAPTLTCFFRRMQVFVSDVDNGKLN